MSTVDTTKLVVFGDVQENALAQMEILLQDERAQKGALMADNHLGYSMPIGGVVAYEDAISPTGVGFDIACGNMAVRTNISLTELAPNIEHAGPAKLDAQHSAVKPIMREIQKKVAFGMGRKNETPFDHPVLDLGNNVWLDIVNAFGVDLHKKATAQLGTVGSGNHYVDLLVDEHGYIWVANHFGSRGLGHTIASGFMSAARGLKFTDRVPESEEAVLLDTRKDLGQFYVEAMKLAGRYAYAGREYVIQQVLDILGAHATFSVHNHHNFSWFENGLWVVRKGATPLTPEPAFIGGSMGDDSYIVQGVAPEEVPDDLMDTLYNRVVDLGNIGSAPHGAGRVMSRTAAAGKMRHFWACNNRDCGYMIRKITVEHAASGEATDGVVTAPEVCPECGGNTFRKVRTRDKTTAAIDWDAERGNLTDRGIVVLGAGADEAPGVYKGLVEVLSAHRNIELVHRLTPIGVVMAGPDEFDPYQD